MNTMTAKTALETASRYATEIQIETDAGRKRFMVGLHNHWTNKARQLAATEKAATNPRPSRR